MSTVDLARVGACVLKHAVTGEVRLDGLRVVVSPGTWQRHPRLALGHRAELGAQAGRAGWARRLGVRGVGRGHGARERGRG